MERPRRAARPSSKALAQAAAFDRSSSSLSPVPDDFQFSIPAITPTARPRRRKNHVTDKHMREGTFLDYVLKDPKSPLTMMDISDLINASVWGMLSPESQNMLKKLLPPTAFAGFKPSLNLDHPSLVHRISRGDPVGNEADKDDAMPIDSQPDFQGPAAPPMDVDTDNEVDLGTFSDPHFLAAAHTFQDHIFSGWMSEEHEEKVKQYQDGIRDGTLSAPWKDEVWELENPAAVEEVDRDMSTLLNGHDGLQKQKANNLLQAGPAKEVKMIALAQKDVIRVGDIIAYKRGFAFKGTIVEKDVLIKAIQPKTHSLTVLYPSGQVTHLPAELLLPSADINSADPLPIATNGSEPLAQVSKLKDPVIENLADASERASDILSVSITTPSTLETLLLDTDGRVEKANRPNGNAWKCFTVYRWRGDAAKLANVKIMDNRGGRENHGTLFYLRGTYYHEQLAL